VVYFGLLRRKDAILVRDLRPVPNLPGLITLIPEEDDAALRDASIRSGLASDRQHRKLGGDGGRTGIFQLMGQLTDGVQRVCGGDDAACPESAEHEDGHVDGIRRVQSKNISLVPIPLALEALAELGALSFDLGEGIGSPGFALNQELCSFPTC